jgi:translocation protein SEC62
VLCVSPLLCSLFDESLSVVDSFKPVYSFDKGSAGQTMYRLGLLVALVAFIVWAASQPTEFDGFLAAQKDFVDDLYSGKHTPHPTTPYCLLISHWVYLV